MSLKTKSLVKMMTYQEALQYILGHNNKFHIPDAEEAERIDDAKHPSFWVSSTLGDRRLVYNKETQSFIRQHPLMKHYVVLIRREDES